jgi:NADPH2:quinone reductase
VSAKILLSSVITKASGAYGSGGGSVGNATFQLARAQGAGSVISTAGSAAKAAHARELGFEDVVDLSAEGLAEGVRRTTAGKGVDIVIDSIGGAVTGEALSSLGLGAVLITLGYSAGRKTTIDLTDLIWKRARMAGFSLFAQSPAAIAAAWRDVIPLMVSGSVKPIVERVYRLGEAGRSLASSDRGSAVRQSRPGGLIDGERMQ